MTRYGQRICQIVHPAQPDPNCACGFTRCDRENLYCERTRLERRVSSSTPAEPGSLDLVAQFDAMAAHSRAKRQSGDPAGAGTDTSTTPKQHAAPRPTVSASASRSTEPRCIANIPTSGKKLAHQCRNRAKYGEYCALHAVGKTVPDVEQFPAALVETPDNLPFAHDD